jgi:hypothetical protein
MIYFYTIFLYNDILFHINMIIDIQQVCKFDVGDCGVLGMDVSGCGI